MDRLFLFPDARPRNPDVDRWFNDWLGPLGLIGRDLFDVLRGAGPDIRDLLHDGHPTACVCDAAFACVRVFTAHVTLGFFRGAELPDSAGLLRGEGRLMRHVRLRPGTMPDDAVLRALVAAAHDRVAALRLTSANGAG